MNAATACCLLASNRDFIVGKTVQNNLVIECSQCRMLRQRVCYTEHIDRTSVQQVHNFVTSDDVPSPKSARTVSLRHPEHRNCAVPHPVWHRWTRHWHTTENVIFKCLLTDSIKLFATTSCAKSSSTSGRRTVPVGLLGRVKTTILVSDIILDSSSNMSVDSYPQH